MHPSHIKFLSTALQKCMVTDDIELGDRTDFGVYCNAHHRRFESLYPSLGRPLSRRRDRHPPNRA